MREEGDGKEENKKAGKKGGQIIRVCARCVCNRPFANNEDVVQSV
jgi:hypothetical protein